MDWYQVKAEFDRLFDGHRFHRRRGLKGFEGTNFMTPEVLGFVDVDGTPVEVSFGTGMDRGTYLFGVTFPRINDRSDDRNDCFMDLESVYNYLYD